MSSPKRACGLAALLLVLPPFAIAKDDGPVTVAFVKPETFSDIRDWRVPSAPGRNPTLRGLREHLERAVPAYLASGQRLTFTFTDIDLAGDVRFGSNPRWNDIRIVSRAFPPRLNFRYSLFDADGVELRAGEVALRDLGFLDTGGDRRVGSLYYERRMLDRWLAKEFGSS